MTGATSVLCSVTLELLVKNPSSRVVYIDCDRGVTPHKFQNLLAAAHPGCDTVLQCDSVLQRLALSQCCGLHELISVLDSVENQFKQNPDYTDIVIVDNILSFYWSHDKYTTRDKIVPKLLDIKPYCSLLISWHPPIRQSDNILPSSWGKLVTRRLRLASQANPRSIVEEGSNHGNLGNHGNHGNHGNLGGSKHCMQFNVDLRNGCVTSLS